MQHSPANLASFRAAQVYGEHFFITGAQETVRAVLERMRDEACPIAVLTESDAIVGVIEGQTVLANVLGQPAKWTEPAVSVSVHAPILSAVSSAVGLSKLLADHAVVIAVDSENKPIKVVTRASWMRFLNVSLNTAVFQPSPHLEPATQPVAK